MGESDLSVSVERAKEYRGKDKDVKVSAQAGKRRMIHSIAEEAESAAKGK